MNNQVEQIEQEEEGMTELGDFAPEFSDDDMDELTGLLHFPGGDDDCEVVIREITSDKEEAELDAEVTSNASAGDDLFDLDNLLGESIKLSKGKFEVSAARKALRRGNSTGVERALLMAIVAKWEIGREWGVEASDALFEVQQCTCCGSVQHHFLGFFQRQRSKTEPTSYRWLAPDHASYVTAELPKGIKEEFFEVPVCIKCAVKQGWGVVL